MSKNAAVFVLILALLSGLFASATVMKYVREQEDGTIKDEVEQITVVVAKEQIPAGTALLPEQIELASRPKDVLPQGYFNKLDDLKERVAQTTIYPGEVILQERLIIPGTPGGLPAIIPEGHRAITLRVDDTSSVAGFIRPGHHVDILVTVDIDEEDKVETISKVILQNVKVLATGQEIEMNEKKGEKKPKVVPTVTVLVTLEQSESIALASNAGSIRLVLRSHTDKKEEHTKGVSLSNLIPKERNKLKPPVEVVYEPLSVDKSVGGEEEKQPVHVVEVYRGSERTDVTFEE